jgi:hypothetical protein
MQSEPRPRSYAMILISTYGGAAGSAVFGILLLVQVFSGHGGPAGNMLRVGIALLAFLVGLFLLTVGILYRSSFGNAESDEFR